MLSLSCYHVIYWCQLPCFTAIHKLSPVASWDSKVSIICTLQNLAEEIAHPGTFCLLFYESCEFRHRLLHFSLTREVCDYGCSLEHTVIQILYSNQQICFQEPNYPERSVIMIRRAVESSQMY